MCRLGVFPKVCVIRRQTGDQVFNRLDMRASSLLTLAFILSAAELPLLIPAADGKCELSELPKNFGKIPDIVSNGENGRFRMPCKDGDVRKAGTSNLFVCRKKNHTAFSWENEPSLRCILNKTKRHTPTVANTLALTTTPNPSPTPSTPGTTKTSYYTTMEKTQSTSAASGSTAFTTSHTVATTTRSSFHTTQRTTTQEEEPMTTTNSIAHPTSATFTGSENLTTVSKQPSVTSTTTTSTTITITTSTEKGPSEHRPWHATTGGIAAGTVLMLIMVATSAAGIFLWCRWRRGVRMEMTLPPGSDLPLLNPSTIPKTCSDSVQSTPLSQETSVQNIQIEP